METVPRLYGVEGFGMLSGRPFVVGVADFGVAHFVRDFHALVDDLFDTAQCRGVIAAVVFRESLFESIPALEGSLPTVIEGRGILLQQLGYLERIVAPTGCVFRSIVQIRSFIESLPPLPPSSSSYKKWL